jgi:hypothetical protein
MTSSYNDVRAVIESRVDAEMNDGPIYPVSFQNIPFTPPNDTPWVAVNIRFGDNNYATLLGPNPGFNRQIGTLVLDVYTPKGVGAGENYTIAERLKDLFDRQNISGIIFDAATGPADVVQPSPEAYFQTQTTITFQAYLE